MQTTTNKRPELQAPSRCAFNAVWVCIGIFVATLVTHTAAEPEPGGMNAVPADRVVLRFQNGGLELLAKLPLLKQLPSSNKTIDHQQARSGFWYELQSADGTVRYRRAQANPLSDRSEKPGFGTLVLVEQVAEEKVFSLIIPRADSGDQLVLFSDPLEQRGPGSHGRSIGAAREIGRISLNSTPSSLEAAPAALDGAVIGVTKIVDHGPASDRLNLVIISEGFQETELAKFRQETQGFADLLLHTSPFYEASEAFNIWRVDVTSTDSGADDPPCGGEGTGTYVSTYFDSTFCSDGIIRRLLTVNRTTVLNVLTALVPEWDTALVIVNSSVWGGAGSVGISTTSMADGWQAIAIHEMGHSVFGLADEYPYYAGCGVDAPGLHDLYSGPEPVEPNVTTETHRTSLKWADLILSTTPIPTTINADCSRCDEQVDLYPRQVGLYEGARFFHCGLYRPAFNCMMRDLSAFCSVCAEHIRKDLSPYLPHPADNSPRDSRLSMLEILGYASAWKTGATWPLAPNPIPIDYVARGGYIWKAGEIYFLNAKVPAPPIWWVAQTAPNGMAPSLDQDLAAFISSQEVANFVAKADSTTVRKLPPFYTPGTPFEVTLSLDLASDVTLWVLEEVIPPGWGVSNISAAGVFDSINNKVKWLSLSGPPRGEPSLVILTYTLTPPLRDSETKSFSGLFGVGSASGEAIIGPLTGDSSIGSDSDSDGDGVLDSDDRCPGTLPGDIVDLDGCSINQLVPCSGPASGGTWKNHGAYVSATAKMAETFVAAGLISEQQSDVLVSQAARSDCGQKR